MTEDQIERKVERMVDRLDAQFMSDSNTMTQEEYDAEIESIDKWAAMEYRRKDGSAPFTARDRALDY